jgi:hypothetical protein
LNAILVTVGLLVLGCIKILVLITIGVLLLGCGSILVKLGYDSEARRQQKMLSRRLSRTAALGYPKSARRNLQRIA